MEIVKRISRWKLDMCRNSYMPNEKAVGFGPTAALALHVLAKELSKMGDENLDLNPESYP